MALRTEVPPAGHDGPFGRRCSTQRCPFPRLRGGRKATVFCGVAKHRGPSGRLPGGVARRLRSGGETRPPSRPPVCNASSKRACLVASRQRFLTHARKQFAAAQQSSGCLHQAGATRVTTRHVSSLHHMTASWVTSSNGPLSQLSVGSTEWVSLRV